MVKNTTVRVFVVILLPLESMEDTRIENLIAEMSALRIRVSLLEAGQEVLDTQRDVALRRGDCTRITNRVKETGYRTGAFVWDKERERVSTVTQVTPKQVHIVTDNGTQTWQAPNNMRRIER